MSDVSNQNSQPDIKPPTQTEASGNSPEARTPDGTLKDQSSSLPSETSDAKSTEPAAKPESSVPEKYTFTAAEGKALDQSLVDKATPIFRELGLDQAAAQKLVDLYNSTLADRAQDGVKMVESMRAGWREQINKDPEMGGRLETILADIGRFKDTLDPKTKAEFNSAMDLTGAGDHPAFLRAFWKLAQANIEGKPVTGAGPSPHGQTRPGENRRPSLASAMYPNLPTSSNAA